MALPTGLPARTQTGWSYPPSIHAWIDLAKHGFQRDRHCSAGGVASTHLEQEHETVPLEPPACY